MSKKITRKQKLLKIINDIPFDFVTDYLYAFVIFGMDKGKFPIPKGHTAEVRKFVANYEKEQREKIAKEPPQEEELTEEEKQLRQYRCETTEMLWKLGTVDDLICIYYFTKGFVEKWKEGATV